MKVGMVPVWDKWGIRYPTTVLQLDDCRVLQVKTDETDGYTALQLGVGEAKWNRVNKSSKGRFDKAGVVPKRKVAEFRVTKDSILPPGTLIQAMHFVPGQVILRNSVLHFYTHLPSNFIMSNEYCVNNFILIHTQRSWWMCAVSARAKASKEL